MFPLENISLIRVILIIIVITLCSIPIIITSERHGIFDESFNVSQ